MIPPEPFDYYLPGTDLTIRFYDFDILQPFARVLDVILFSKASKDAINVHSKADVPIDLDLVYTATSEVPGVKQKVILAFFPGPKMTWKTWSEVILGLVWFTGCYEDVGLHFIVLQQFEGKVAEGHIINDVGPTTDSK